MRSPTGRIVVTNRPVTTRSGLEVNGVKPLIIAYVKTGSRNMRNDFLHHVAKFGLDARPIHAFSGSLEKLHGGQGEMPYLAAYEVTGTPEALEAITARQCVKEWHFSLAVSVGRFAAGSGEVKALKPNNGMEPVASRGRFWFARANVPHNPA